MNDTCVFCKKPMGVAYVTASGGVAHPVCYVRRNPPPVAHGVRQVLCGSSDPVLAADIIVDVLEDHPEVAEEIVKRFNHQQFQAWLLRCLEGEEQP